MTVWPARYQVTKVGQPDPEASAYLVVDVVHDFEARVLVARMASGYQDHGKPERARELLAFLADTKAAHAAHCEKMNAVERGNSKTAKAHARASFS